MLAMCCYYNRGIGRRTEEGGKGDDDERRLFWNSCSEERIQDGSAPEVEKDRGDNSPCFWIEEVKKVVVCEEPAKKERPPR